MPLPRDLPRLFAISDRRSLGGRSLDEWTRGIAEALVPGLQLREKDLPDRELYIRAERARHLYPPPGRLFVNGRPDVALAVGADGVHLPARGLPTAAVRDRFGETLWVGRSTHTLSEIERAHSEGADYVLFGPVWATPGKARATGLERLREAAALGVPVYAVGGVEADRLETLAAAGAAGAAAIRLFADPLAAARAVAAAARAFAHGE